MIKITEKITVKPWLLIMISVCLTSTLLTIIKMSKIVRNLMGVYRMVIIIILKV
jgi:hypothetical protein